MTSKITFEVTEKAGSFVAGQRSPGAGKPIQLTEDQAYYALIAGELRRPQPARPKTAKRDIPSEE